MMKHLNESVELIAHVAIEPNDFRTRKKLAFHKIPRKERQNYWFESFQQAGLEAPMPIDKRWLVSVADIHDERLLQHLLSRSWQKLVKASTSRENFLGKIEGGISLLHQGKIVYSAQCCSDLGNLKDWQAAAKSRDSQWQMLWNGHPWIYSRYEDGHVIFSDYTESDAKPRGEGKYAIPIDVLESAVQKASQDLEAFSERLYALWLAEKKQG